MDTIILGDALICTTPRHIVTSEGMEITSFRVATNRQGEDQRQSNWYTVSAFREVAVKMYADVSKGDRLTFVGTPIVRDWQNDDRTGTTIEVVVERYYPIRVASLANA